jgi:hypothetical protein
MVFLNSPCRETHKNATKKKKKKKNQKGTCLYLIYWPSARYTPVSFFPPLSAPCATSNKFLQNRPKKRNPTQKQPTDSPFFFCWCFFWGRRYPVQSSNSCVQTSSSSSSSWNPAHGPWWMVVVVSVHYAHADWKWAWTSLDSRGAWGCRRPGCAIAPFRFPLPYERPSQGRSKAHFLALALAALVTAAGSRLYVGGWTHEPEGGAVLPEVPVGAGTRPTPSSNRRSAEQRLRKARQKPSPALALLGICQRCFRPQLAS